MQYISFDLRGDFGYFKKGDANDIVQPTYNIIHKPALLGLLGAILGLKGYSDEYYEFPEYYETLKSIRVGIKPLYPEYSDCYFPKTIVWFNNSSGLASNEGTLQIKEQILIDPGYTVFLELESSNEIHIKLKKLIFNYQAVYNIYLGKNEFLTSIENVYEYEQRSEQTFNSNVKISTIFKADHIKIKNLSESVGLFSNDIKRKFINFENLPISFDEKTFQHKLAKFAYTNYEVEVENNNSLILLFSEPEFQWVYMF